MAGQEAPFDFASTFRRLRHKACEVHGVAVKGNERTKQDVIVRELGPVLEAKTLDELKDGLLASYARLDSLGIFKTIEFLADAGPDDVPNSANIAITVEEKPVLGFHAGTFVQGGEGSVETTVRLQNGLGYAETFELNAAYGSQQSSTYALTAVQPRWIGLDTQLEMRACQTHKSFQKHSSFTELLRGFSATVVSGPHQAEYELAWRQLAHAAEPGSGFSASKAVRAQAGDSLKSALKYAFSVDRRDSSVVPSEGWAVRLRSELAGLGPDSTFLRFFRQEAEAQVVVPLLRGVALALSTHAGALVPLAGPGGGGAAAAAQQPSLISDRFFLGGPGSLRGFRTKGVGPTDERVPVRGESGAAAADAPLPAKAPRDALGGDVLLSGAAVVTVEMPEALGPLRALGIHAHCFVNAGTLLPLREARAGGLEGLKQSARAACGVGLVFPLVFGRLEANYCRVLRAAEHDRLARWQVGLSSHGL